jgi:hypothetical protein
MERKKHRDMSEKEGKNEGYFREKNLWKKRNLVCFLI